MNKVLLDYFNYLRDTSKNLILPGDGYRCLIPKFTKKLKNDVVEVGGSFFQKNIVNKDDIGAKNIALFLSQMKKETNKQVYFGIGYILGYQNKRIFGSIVNIPIVFEQEEFRQGTLSYKLDYNNATLNYDLIASILPDYFSSETDDTANDILNILTEKEENIKKTSNLEYLQEQIHELFTQLRKANKNINIEFLKEEIEHKEIVDLKNKNGLINKKDLFYRADKYHIFIADMPDAISTWENLKYFCDEIQSNSFNSGVLNEFFSNVFSFEKNQAENTEEINYADFIKEYIPLDISEKQIIAINNCFNSNISYIQGPPGTGKSHTISSIILSSILSGKKTLVVSQKQQALDVVSAKIKDFFDPEVVVPFIAFDKEAKMELKNSILNMANEQTIKDIDLAHYNSQLSVYRNNLKKINEIIKSKTLLLENIYNSYATFFEQNETFNRKLDVFFKNPIYDKNLKKNIEPLKTNNNLFIEKIKVIEKKYLELECLTKYDEIFLKRLEKQFNVFFKTEINFINLFKNRILSSFVENLFSVLFEYGNNEKIKSKLINEEIISTINYEINTLKEESLLARKTILSLFHKKKLLDSLKDPVINSEVQKFGKMLHWNKGDLVIEKMEKINFNKLLEVFPVWLSEIRNIGEILPNKAEIFDLVIVDEASQVNLAEVLPIFYRAKKICVVGDHKQLGLNASGLTFSLSKKFDKIIWNKYKPNGIDFDMANFMNLTISKASILDLIRSEENKETFKYVMLDEHYRSLPGLTAFNNKEFYDGELKVMTEIPSKTLVKCFSAIKVLGEKQGKTNTAEAQEVINTVKFLIGKKLPKDLEEKYREEIILNKFVPKEPTIGIISAIRDQVEYIKDLLDCFTEEDFNKHRIVCGTPEEFQGDEFDIVIISTTTDEDSRNNGHYANMNRFNVASSRARYYTVFVYSDVSRIPMYEKYLQHFGVFGQRQRDPFNILNWEYEKSNNEHSFVEKVDQALKDILEEIAIDKNIRLFNNITSCGQKIKFGIFNEDNEKFIAVEPIGILEKNDIEALYGSKIIKKIEILNKVGWKIATPTYHKWIEEKCEKEREKLKQIIIEALL